jgi:tyrosinase
MRFPIVPDSSATSCMWRTRRAFNANQKAFQSGVYQLLTNARYKNYTVFSNEGHWNGGYSLETEHDDPHALLGGSNGTMFPIELSGFEPGFWLHHAMVDRLYSLWAILNPDSYVEPEPADEKTFTTAVGDIEDVNSPLSPFHADRQGTFWTANTAIYTETLNYAYPETVKLAGETDADVLAKVTAAINALYGPKAAPPPTKLRRYPGVARRRPASILSSRTGAPNITGTYREYTSSLTFPQSSLPGPYTIYLFLGSVDESDTSNWLFSNNLVGTNAIFAHFDMDREVSDKPLTKTLSLNDSLKKAVDAGKLKSLHADEVTPYLKANLKYRFLLRDEKVDITTVKDLSAEVVSSVVTPGKDSTELPSWGPEEQVLKVDLSA